MGAPLVTVVVDNYNYAPYLRQCIDSALGQSYPLVEVVVVDDGSSDGSVEIIRSYCARVVPIVKPNGGQGSAFNAGFARSRGELVMYLDADDYYAPNAVEQVVAAARGGAAIVQFRLHLVDSDGEPMGEFPPRDVRLDSGDVVPLLTTRGGFSKVMTSGTAFRRDALDRVMPMPEESYRLGAEGYLLHTVPFLGRVAAIERPLGFYRVHTRNNGGIQWQSHVDAAYVRRRMAFWQREAELVRIWAHARRLPVEPRLDLRNHGHLVMRLASLKLEPERHLYADDRAWTLSLHAARAVLSDRALSRSRRALLAAWLLMVAAAPRGQARRLIDAALVPGSPRPSWLRALVLRSRRRHSGGFGVAGQPPSAGTPPEVTGAAHSA